MPVLTRVATSICFCLGMFGPGAAGSAEPSDEGVEQALHALQARIDKTQARALLDNQRGWQSNRDKACPQAESACLVERDRRRVRVLEGKPEAGPGVPGRLVPVFLERHGGRSGLDVSVQFYRFPVADTAGKKALNAMADRLLSEAPKRTAPGEKVSYERKSTIAYGSDRLLSIVVDSWDYEGGAHGANATRVVNLDLQTGRSLTYADLFETSAGEAAFKLCMADIAGQKRARGADTTPEDRSSTEAGVRKAMQRLGAWRFGAEDATVVFNEDEIGAHAEGEYACRLSYAQLKPIAKPGFPLP